MTRLGGWAEAFVGRCRCGAFLAPQWAVDDELACAFARAFYDALEDGRTLGQATQLARGRLAGLSPHDPAYLAYSVYAYPNARVAFGQNGG